MSDAQLHGPTPSTWEFHIGDRLAKALTVAGVNNLEMAEYLGISANTIGNYTSGRTAPKMQTLRLWALRTGAPLDWLLTGIDPTNEPTSDYKAAVAPVSDISVFRDSKRAATA
jgi:transcriptional regulator with XRE-family HTH domain